MIAWDDCRRLLAIDEADVLHIVSPSAPCQRSAIVGWPTQSRRQRTQCNIRRQYREKRLGMGDLTSVLSSKTRNLETICKELRMSDVPKGNMATAVIVKSQQGRTSP